MSQEKASPGGSKRMPSSIAVSESTPGTVVVTPVGRFSLDEAELLAADLNTAARDSQTSKLVVDLSKVTYLDSAAALSIKMFAGDMEQNGRPVMLAGMGGEVRRIMDMVDPRIVEDVSDSRLSHPEPVPGTIEGIGETAVATTGSFKGLMVFTGELIRAVLHSLFHPRDIRWGDVAGNMRRVGVQGLPIVGLISLLVGLIIAFMSSLQLKPLGGDIFVAALVGIAMVKELAPLMTAIIVAGRSGSAFAAEIGTMVVNEEVDALAIMGFDPVRFLVIPRVAAALIVVPLLTLYADFFGLLGGLLVGMLGLDLTFITYIDQTGSNIALSDVTTGLVKSVVFAVIVSGIGCYHGMRVTRGAEGVGRATTAAVVSAIFFIVLADSIFAVVLHYL
jgi:phospholipid/cholesterol/gamma-HCH transport system permease protein